MNTVQYYQKYWDTSKGLPPPLHDDTNPKRAALLFSSIKSLKTGSKILDAGCGNGFFTKQLNQWGFHSVGLDITHHAFSNSDQNCIKLIGSLEKLFPFKDSSFEGVYSGEVIEHLFNVGHFVSECSRVLKRRGLLILTTPYHGKIKNFLISLLNFEKHFDVEGPHIRFFSVKSLKNLLNKNSFQVTCIKSVGRIPLLAKLIFIVAVKEEKIK